MEIRGGRLFHITDKVSLAQAVSHDYVCAEYKGSYRNNDNFISSNCLPVDCDNDHSEDPEEWKYPSDIADAFPGVAFAVHYSRNHMKAKNGKPARPKFHVFFAIDPVTDAEQYASLKKLSTRSFRISIPRRWTPPDSSSAPRIRRWRSSMVP